MKQQTKKLLSLLLTLVMVVGLLPVTVFAEETRTPITAVVASAPDMLNLEAGDTVPTVTFTVTSGSPAYFDSDAYGYRWQKKNGTNWESYTNSTFTAGTYRYECQVRTDDTTEYVLANGCTVTVNGNSWGTLAVGDASSGPDFSYAWTRSPEFVIDPAPLSFNKISSYDVPNSKQDVAITPIKLIGGVKGGLAPYTFSKSTGPEWLSVSAEGVVTGTPRNEDIVGFGQTMQVRVDDSSGQFVTFVLNVGRITPAIPDNPIVTQIVGTATGLNPKAGDKLAFGNNSGKPEFNINSEGSHFDGSAADPYWLKWDGTQWVKLESDATAEAGGKYKYFIDCLHAKPGYTFGETVTVSINGNTDGTAVRTSDWYVYWTSPVITVPEETTATYTVKHMQEKLDALGTFELVDTQTLTGNVGEQTAATVIKYKGFNLGGYNVEQKKITADGKTEVIINYFRNRATIYFEPNGGTGKPYTQDFVYGQPLTALKKNAFTREGYHFVSWNGNEQGTGSTCLDEAVVIPSKVCNPEYGNTHIGYYYYAQWEKNETPSTSVTITHDANGGIKGPAFVESYQAIIGKTIGFSTPPDDFVKAPVGKQFAGVVIEDVFYPVDSKYTVAKNVTIKLIWEDVSASTATYTVKHMQEKLGALGTYEEVTPDRQDLTGIVGEDTVAVAKNYPGFTAKTISQKKITEDGKTVVEVRYDRNRMIIRFDANGGTGKMADLMFAFGETKKFPANAFTREGYEFTHWNMKSDGTGFIQYEDQLETTFSNYELKNNTVFTLYAQWEKNEIPSTSVTITHDANGGIKGPAFVESYQAIIGNTIGFSTPPDDFVKAPVGKQFAGVEIENVFYPVDSKYTVAKDVTIKLIWEDKEAPHIHKGNKINGKTPTCTAEGLKDYYECECGKFFEDAACTKEIPDLEDWKSGDGKLAMLPHTPGELKHDNTKHWKECTVCNTVVEEAKHSYGKWNVITAATENKDGLEKRVCTVCGHEETHVIPALGKPPKTGDNSNVMMWTLLGLVSLSGVAAILNQNKKKKHGTK